MLLLLFIIAVMCVSASISQNDDNAFEEHGHYVDSKCPKPIDIRVCTRLELLGLFQKPQDHELCDNHPEIHHVSPMQPDNERYYDFCQDPKHLIHFRCNNSLSQYEHFSMFKKDHKDSLLQVKNYLMNATSPEEFVRMAKGIRHCLHDYLFHAALLSALSCKNYGFDTPLVVQYDPPDFIESRYLETILEKDMEYYGPQNSIPKVLENPEAREETQQPVMVQQIPDNIPTESTEMPKENKEIAEPRYDQPLKIKSMNAQIYITGQLNCGHECDTSMKNLLVANISKRSIKESEMLHFSSGEILNRKKKQVRSTVSFETLPNGNFRLTKTADLSGSDPYPENRVAYFREDFGLNSHHYNWHLVNLPGTPRRYDYFIYMHRQMVARYNAERFSVNLPRAVSYGDLRQPIAEGHNPNLGFDNNQFGERPPNSIPASYPEVSRSIPTHDQFRNNLERGISSRQVDDAGFAVMLERYHDSGHVLIATTAINGPTNVMVDAPTSGRDTVFYRWHTHIDEMCERYADMKRQVTGETLTMEELVVPTLVIRNAQISSFRETDQLNEIITGCSYHTTELSNGLDFRGNEQAFIHMTHLDHVPFTHHILADNTGPEERRGIVRIFIAPKHDQNGNIFNLEAQRMLWIELDKFMYTFSPGRNYIRRNSQRSSVTVDCRDTFDDIAERIQSNRHVLDQGHCGCGWPQHLLVPRGKPEGMPFALFVVISDDHHIQASDWRLGRSTYCGIPTFDLPDRRPMGYPFHHPAPGNYPDVAAFANSVSNAFSVDISIRFTGFQTDESEASIPSCRQPPR